ncbi:MAG: nucleoside kinase [FCB group bacterium]|nr:nucleoside kinase [FCB group bacterium]
MKTDYYHRSARLATLGFFLAKAFKELLEPRQLVIEHSFGDGLFCHEAHWQKISKREIRLLQHAMEAWIGNIEPIRFTEKPKSEALEFFTETKSLSKQEIVKKWPGDMIPIIIFENYWDICTEPISMYKNRLKPFELRPYNRGFLLRSGLDDQSELPPFVDRPRLFSILEEQETWSRTLGVRTVRELNEIVRSGDYRELLWVAEGLHEKKLARIADQLVDAFPGRKIICVAGPSSSGKTTFAKRLCIQLRVNGFKTLALSMDDYFLDRDRIPKGPDGTQDFEALTAMNTRLLSEQVDDLLQGKSIPRRKFDFSTGQGVDLKDTCFLGDQEFILLEGIHGLNPKFIEKLGSDRVQKIYISAITTLNVDAQHRISTSDNRLLRRMVRDYQFRGYSPRDTISRWDSVRAGEEEHIFPYQEEADTMFNSSLIYELSVLSGIAAPLLQHVKGTDIVEEKAEYLHRFLSFFEPIDPEGVPSISLLREFVGNSGFSY